MGLISGKKHRERRGSILWRTLLPALLVVIIYLPAVRFDFISLDDNLYLLDNYKIKLGLSWEGIKWAFTTLYTTNWHPLTWLSLLAEYQVFGLNPMGYHVVGVVLHALNSVLLFFVLQGMTGEKWKSLVVASLFAVHPLNIESVAWIAERKNLISTLFGFLTIWSYTHYVRRSGVARYLGTVFLFAVGLMAKPMVVSLPFILLLLDYWPLRRFSFSRKWFKTSSRPGRDISAVLPFVVEKIPFFVLSFFSVLITIYAAKTGGAAKSLLAFPLFTRIENALISYCSYLNMLVRPVELAIYYPYPGVISHWHALTALLCLAAVTGVVLSKAREYGYLATGWFWYLITLLPVIGILQVGRQAMANRYAYLPFIGIFVIVVWGVNDLFGYLQRVKYLRIFVAISAVFYLGFLSFLELGYWKDSESAYRRALDTTKDNHIAAMGAGNVMLSRGNPAEAEGYYRKSLRITPDYELAHYNLGLSLKRQGKMEEAEACFRQALQYDPYFAKAYNELGDLFAKEGKIREAKVLLEKALALDPDLASARENLSLLLKGVVE
jgi:tetratricopeptide (TPR) repeat protein